MISQEAIQQILGIKDKVAISPEEMAQQLTFTVFPYNENTCSKEMKIFFDRLHVTLLDLGVKIIPYNESLETVPILKICKRFFKIVANNFLFTIFEFLGKDHGYYKVHWGAIANLRHRERIRKGISVITLGDHETSKLPIDYTSSFTRSSVITIIDRPENINENSDFKSHFDTAMNAFSHYMTQLVILVDADKWILYNFNASHPIYELNGDFRQQVLHALIPKVAAPIRPHIFRDFIVEQESFDINKEPYVSVVNDFIDGGRLFHKTNLYPDGKKIKDLPFRNGFYRWIGEIHLDHRSGMSYGFLARQLPVMTSLVLPIKEARAQFGLDIDPEKDYFYHKGELFVIIEVLSGIYCVKLPPIWVLTQRSGADKTKINPSKDMLMLGLINGVMHMKTPKGMHIMKDYRPSFDTKVILAHGVGNAIIASLMEYHGTKSYFYDHIVKQGIALVHWHGYIQKPLVPEGYYVHGQSNPHVACSTSQSAIYALGGKLNMFLSLTDWSKYKGDIHIEPHHGTNVNFPSIADLALFLLDNPHASELGNKYLKGYL